MKKKQFFMAFVDGCFSFLILYGVLVGAIAEATIRTSTKQLMMIDTLAALLSAGVYLLFLKKQTNKRSILYFSLKSIFIFFACFIVVFLMKIMIPFSAICYRETNAGDGILILFLLGWYACISSICRICIATVIASTMKS